MDSPGRIILIFGSPQANSLCASAPKFRRMSFTEISIMWQRLNQIFKDRLRFSWHLETRRTLLMLSGLLVCVYSVWALCYVQTIPDLGLKSAFDTTIKGK